MHPEYAAALEKQLDWLRWIGTAEGKFVWEQAPKYGVKSIRTDGTQGSMADAMVSYTRPLLYGDVYHVSPRISTALQQKAEADPPPDIAFDPGWLVSEYGFVVLGAPLDLRAGVQRTEPLRVKVDEQRVNIKDDKRGVEATAFGWSPVKNGIQFAFYGPRLSISVKQDALRELIADMKAQGNVGPDDDVTIEFTDEQVGEIRVDSGFYPISWMTMRWGVTWRQEALEYRRRAALANLTEDCDAETRFVVAFFLFINDRRVAIHAHRADRGQRKRAAALKPNPTEKVQVITLRAEEQSGYNPRDPDHVPLVIDWAWRWQVREHKRRHPRTGLKTITVKEYEKGPADRPLKPADRRRLFAVEK